MGKAITIFASSHEKAPVARAIRAISGEDWSHAGLRYDHVKTFEARWRVGTYDWTEYLDGEHRLIEVELTAVSDERLLRAFYEVKREFEGSRYNLTQLLSMVPWALWRRVGVDREVAISRLCVCSEIVWRFIDAIGSPYQGLLRLFWEKDKFAPWDILTFARTNSGICTVKEWF